MGEKYNAVNQKGRTAVNRVEEKFCFQGEKTYCPAPFFWTDAGVGVYVDTLEPTEFTFGKDKIKINMPESCDVVLFSGTPAQIIQEYMGLFGPGKAAAEMGVRPMGLRQSLGQPAENRAAAGRAEQSSLARPP